MGANTVGQRLAGPGLKTPLHLSDVFQSGECLLIPAEKFLTRNFGIFSWKRKGSQSRRARARARAAPLLQLPTTRLADFGRGSGQRC